MKNKFLLGIPVVLVVIAFLAFGVTGAFAANSNNGAAGTAPQGSQEKDQMAASFEASFQRLFDTISAAFKSDHLGQAHFTGQVQSVSGDVWMIAGKKVVTDSRTNFVQSPKAGDMVMVNATVQADGSFQARVIKTITSEEQPEPNVVVFTGKVMSISGSDWMVGDKKVVTDTTTQVIGSPVVGDMVQVKATPQTDGSFLALVIRKVTSEEEETGKVVEFRGTVMSISGDTWVVGDRSFTVNSSTKMEGSPVKGDMVNVEAVKQADGTLVAMNIELLGERNEEGSGSGETPIISVPVVTPQDNPGFIGMMPGRGRGHNNEP